MDIGPSEAETFWTAFLRKLARRGLRGVKLVVSDAHEGIKATVAKVLNASCSVAACASCATRWRMPAEAAGASSPPSSPPRLPRTMLRPREHNGGRSPTYMSSWLPLRWQQLDSAELEARRPRNAPVRRKLRDFHTAWAHSCCPGRVRWHVRS
jgi:Transposase, Mutator family